MHYFKGEKQIDIVKHNGSKSRMSACLTVTSDGQILPILCVFLYTYKRKNSTTQRTFPKKYEKHKNMVAPMMIRFNPTGFNNEVLFNEWLEKIIVVILLKNL